MAHSSEYRAKSIAFKEDGHTFSDLPADTSLPSPKASGGEKFGNYIHNLHYL
jgi:hypothetical protein